MKNFTVIDNFLPESEHKNIYDLVFNSKIPLYFQYNTLPSESLSLHSELNQKHKIELEGHPYFFHIFFQDLTKISDWDEAYSRIIEKINPFALMRIKLNLSSNIGKGISSGWHVDMGDDGTKIKYTTAIYHINTNNGYTLFEDGTKIKSVANRLVTFPGNTLHTGITQTDEDARAFINFNYIE